MKPDAPLADHSCRSGRAALRQNVNKSPDRLKPLHDLYEGESIRADQFRYGLLVFDLVTIAFIVVTSFLPRGLVVEVLDVGFGLVILADFLARLALCRQRAREFLHPATWADLAAIVSFLAPLVKKVQAFFASCAPCGFCTRISFSNAFARTVLSSSATKRSYLRARTFSSSSL